MELRTDSAIAIHELKELTVVSMAVHGCNRRVLPTGRNLDDVALHQAGVVGKDVFFVKGEVQMNHRGTSISVSIILMALLTACARHIPQGDLGDILIRDRCQYLRIVTDCGGIAALI